MMMGPDPINRIELRSVRLGILTSFLQMSLLVEGIETARNYRGGRSKFQEGLAASTNLSRRFLANRVNYARVREFVGRDCVAAECNG